jgi:hypothetical protein
MFQLVEFVRFWGPSRKMRQRCATVSAILRLVLVPLAHVSLFAPTLSRAFHLQSAAGFRSSPPRLCVQSRPLAQSAAVAHLGTATNRRKAQQTLLLCAESSSLSGGDLVQIAGQQLHKFGGLGCLLLFEGAVGSVLKSCGIALPPSVCWKA